MGDKKYLPMIFDPDTGTNLSERLAESLGRGVIEGWSVGGRKQPTLTHVQAHGGRIIGAYDSRNLVIWQYHSKGMLNDPLLCGLAEVPESLAVTANCSGALYVYSGHTTGVITAWAMDQGSTRQCCSYVEDAEATAALQGH